MSVVKGESVAYCGSVTGNPSTSIFPSVPWPDALTPPTPPFDPDQIPNLTLWLNLANPATVSFVPPFNDITGIESDGTVPSDNVTQADLGLTFTYIDVADPPFAAVAPGRSPWMTLNGGGNTARWWVFVFAMGQDSPTSFSAPLLVQSTNENTGFVGFNFPGGMDGQGNLFDDNGQQDIRIIDTPNDQSRHVLEIQTDGLGTVGDIYVDGTLMVTNYAVNDFLQYSRLGCNDSLFPLGVENMQLCEVFMANTNLPVEMRTAFYNYLFEKWGIGG